MNKHFKTFPEPSAGFQLWCCSYFVIVIIVMDVVVIILNLSFAIVVGFVVAVFLACDVVVVVVFVVVVVVIYVSCCCFQESFIMLVDVSPGCYSLSPVSTPAGNRDEFRWKSASLPHRCELSACMC